MRFDFLTPLPLNVSKVGWVFLMVISPEFRMRQYRDDHHWEDTPHFTCLLFWEVGEAKQIPKVIDYRLPNPGRWSLDLGNACLDVYFCLLACCLLAVLFILTSSLSVLEILNILRFKIHEFYHMVCQKTNLFGSKGG